MPRSNFNLAVMNNLYWSSGNGARTANCVAFRLNITHSFSKQAPTSNIWQNPCEGPQRLNFLRTLLRTLLIFLSLRFWYSFPDPPIPAFWPKSEDPPKKTRISLYAEPLKALEKRAKPYKKARKTAKRKKRGKRKKQGLEGQGCFFLLQRLPCFLECFSLLSQGF